jgi:membrane-associated phospholipid phosphatase
MIGVAAPVGIGRIMTERHYPTDTLLAWGIGALAGYVVPSALHYGFGTTPKASAAMRRRPAPSAVRLAVVPGAGTSTAGATLAGVF